MANIQKIQEHYGVHLITCEVPSSMGVVSCFGLVHGQAIQGANFVKGFFAKVSAVTGGRVSGYEKELDLATAQSLKAMARRAAELGANTVVAVRLQTSSIGPRMLLAACSGAAFVLREKRTKEDSCADDTPKYQYNYPLG